jgi:hypothetical protein
MAEKKLKLDNVGDNYGSISHGGNSCEKEKTGLFSWFRSGWNYKKIQENVEKPKAASFFSMVSSCYLIMAFGRSDKSIFHQSVLHNFMRTSVSSHCVGMILSLISLGIQLIDKIHKSETFNDC